MKSIATLFWVLAAICVVCMQVFHSNDALFWSCAGLTLLFGALGGGLIALGAWKPDAPPPPR